MSTCEAPFARVLPDLDLAVKKRCRLLICSLFVVCLIYDEDCLNSVDDD